MGDEWEAVEGLDVDNERELEGHGSRTRLTSGDTFGRWTVVRSAGFKHQAGRNRARCVVRCVCGAERVAFEYMLKGGRTHGCTSRKCLSRWEAGEEIRRRIADEIDRYIQGRGGDDNG